MTDLPWSTDAFFSAVGRSAVQTSAGPCDLPIFYKDTSFLTLIYRVDPAAAAPLVDPAFEPWVVLGKGLVLLCLFDYRTTTIGPYGEIGLGALVKRRATSPSLLRAALDMRKEKDAGLFIFNLLVLTAKACAAGRELWGYPKYVTPIDASFTAAGARIALGSELVVTMGPSRGLSTRGLPFVLFSVNEGRVPRTIVDVDNQVRWGGAATAEVAITGDGPTSRTVKALGLDRAKPALAFRTDAMRSILPAGVQVLAPG